MKDITREDLNEMLDSNWGADITNVEEEDLEAVCGLLSKYLHNNLEK